MKKTADAMPAKKSALVETVDDYLAAVTEDARTALEKLRKTIKAAAPRATEVISYQIPAYKHHGLLVGFAALKDHCTFHIMSTHVTRAQRLNSRATHSARRPSAFQLTSRSLPHSSRSW